MSKKKKEEVSKLADQRAADYAVSKKEEEKKEDSKKDEKDQRTADKDQKIAEQEQRIAELTDLLQHLQAEFENYKKRTEKDFERCRSYANAELIAKLLPIIDSFEFALKHSGDTKHFVIGVKLIHNELMKVLEKEGLKPVECVGKPLDPYKHEVLLQEPSDKVGIVLEELQKGYTFNDRVIRCAKVKLAKEVEAEKEAANANNKKDEEGNNT
jgi:molecular chaperone GrpE